MALLVKKVVVTEVAVTTVKIDVNAAIVLDAAGEKIQCANAVNWLPAQLDIDIETGVIRNWSVPTGEQLQHTENADDLLLDALDHPAPTVGVALPHYVTKDTTEKEFAAIVENLKKNPATTTPEIQQPVEVAALVQPEDVWWPEDSEPRRRCPISGQLIPFEFDTIDSFRAAQPAAPQANCGESAVIKPNPVEFDRIKTPEIEGIKTAENHQIDAEPTDSNVQKLHIAELGQTSEAFDQGVAIAESVLAPVEPVAVDEPTTHLPTVTVSHKSGKWCATHGGESSTSTQGLYEAIKGVLNRCGMTGAYEINKLKADGDVEVFTVDGERTLTAETVYLTKMADGWVAKTPKNKTVSAAISINGHLAALLDFSVGGIAPEHAKITDTTDDEMRSKNKRRYSITKGGERDVKTFLDHLNTLSELHAIPYSDYLAYEKAGLAERANGKNEQDLMTGVDSSMRLTKRGAIALGDIRATHSRGEFDAASEMMAVYMMPDSSLDAVDGLVQKFVTVQGLNMLLDAATKIKDIQSAEGAVGSVKHRLAYINSQISAAPAHAPAVPQPQDEEPLSYAQIIALINHASEVVHLDNIMQMRVANHADSKERVSLTIRLSNKQAAIMAANAMPTN